MTIIITPATFFLSWIILRAKNPVKIGFILICTRTLLLYWMAIERGGTWFPLIIYLLFIGGILIIFLILSSLLPNEKSQKNKISLWITLVLILLGFYFAPMLGHPKRIQDSALGIKRAITSRLNIITIGMIILLYFLIFVSIISRNKSPLRINMCRKKRVL